MNKVVLGNTGLSVSRLCFGALTIGPLQANLPIDEGSSILAYALKQGINFIDTAQLYGTYPYIKEAIRKTGIRPVISTKSYAYNKEQAETSLEEARKLLDIDVIDIFMLHEQVSELTLKGHQEALDYYLNQKEHGKIRAVGVSTHAIEVVNVASLRKEIDIIAPMLNMKGLGIIDGTLLEMENAICKAKKHGKSIVTMKPLGGGNCISNYDQCFSYLFKNENIDSIAVGMRSEAEIDMNIATFSNTEISESLKERVSLQNRQLHIEFWCEKCQKCIKRCQANALSFSNGEVIIDHEKCVLCGYCASVCDVFAIKIF